MDTNSDEILKSWGFQDLVGTFKVSAVHLVEAVKGGVAKLPCDTTPSLPDDKVQIVIWYKEGLTRKSSPIYTFDSRDKPIEEGKHWADENILGGRAFFRYSDSPSKLTLDIVKESDAGVYQCRVDFQRTPTRNIKINASVIVPPEKLRILDEKGSHISHYILGPYNEGASINITCVASGGRPPPKVTWWQDNALLDDSCEYLSEKRVRNVLHLEKLQRRHLHSVFTCQASNNNIVAPISNSVTLDLNLRPLSVKLMGDNKPLSADNSYELGCEVIGSRPAPTVTWWKGSQQMLNTKDTASSNGNSTISVLTIVPSIGDAGKYLSCRGQQQLIQDSGIEDGWRLDIHHIPLVTLELGSNLNGTVIKEGVDVYFECNIKSNPWVYRVSWRHNGKVLNNNPTVGTIVSNQSLVLQSVTRKSSGTYTCIGSNPEGDGESNSVHLDVKYAPLCRPGQPKSYGVARDEITEIRCELEANPADIQFTWKVNNSDNNALIMQLPQNLITVERSLSILSYKPTGDYDYGMLLCSGRNKIGDQIEPCIFYINPAGKPDAPLNCTIENQTTESLYVECSEGFDGGLQQEFVMEIYDVQAHKMVSSVSTKNPVFSVGGLESGLAFDVELYAVNRKGKSSIVRLHAFTLKSAEKHVATTRSLPIHISPVFGALIGVMSALMLVAIIVVALIRFRRCGSEPQLKAYVDEGLPFPSTQSTNADDKGGAEPSLDFNGSIESLDEKDPDIIPQNNSDEYCSDDTRAYIMLNNTISRNYSRLVISAGQNGPHHYEDARIPKQNEFNQVCVPHHEVPYVIYNRSAPSPALIRQDPLTYSNTEGSNRMFPCLQPLSPPYVSTLQRKQRQLLLPHTTCPSKEEQIAVDKDRLFINPNPRPNLEPC